MKKLHKNYQNICLEKVLTRNYRFMYQLFLIHSKILSILFSTLGLYFCPNRAGNVVKFKKQYIDHFGAIKLTNFFITKSKIIFFSIKLAKII